MGPLSLIVVGFLLLHLFVPVHALPSDAGAALRNVTFDDTDPAIIYIGPDGAWNASTVMCAACNNPPTKLALHQTYHKGAFVLPPVKMDDATQTATEPIQKTAPSPPKTSPSGKAQPDGGVDDNNRSGGNDGGGKDSNGNGGDGKGSPSGGSSGRHGSRSTRRQPSDTPLAARRAISETVDSSVSALFNFTGVAVYVVCIQPLGVSRFPEPATLINASFSIDGAPIRTFIHQGSATNSQWGFAPNIVAFAQSGLDGGPHLLAINLAPNSVFILDSILVTQDATDTSASLSSALSSATSSPRSSSLSGSASNSNDKNGRASFGGLLGGVLGVLGTLSFGTALSIYWRRRRSAARERAERGGSPPPSSEQGPPAAFVPRYFPGTYVPVRPTTPPPYEASGASHSSSTSDDEGNARVQALRRSYDVPPPLEELEAAPPAFGDAIASPAVPVQLVVLPASA